MDDHTDIVEYLRRNAAFNYKDTYLAAADEIERLRAERDEARREVCNLSIHPPRDYALERGWNCFKENTND